MLIDARHPKETCAEMITRHPVHMFMFITDLPNHALAAF
jgi:hypothetical protein